MSERLAASRFRRGLLWTSSGSITSLVLLALETVVAVRLLPTDVFGAYVLLQTTVAFLMMVIDFGVKVTTVQMISSGDPTRRERVISTALAFRLVVILSAALLIWLLRGWLIALGLAPELTPFIVYIPLMLAAASLDELLFAILQGLHAYRAMVIAQLLRGSLRIMLSVGLLVLLDAGIVALVVSWCASFAVAIAYQLLALPRRALRIWHWSVLTEMLRFGASLQATRFLAFLSSRLHLTLLGALGGVDSVAFFAAADRIPEALKTVSDSYFRVYFPTMSTLLTTNRQAAAAMFARSLRLVAFGGALGALGAILFSHEIVTVLFSARYAASVPIFCLLMLALHLTLIVNVFGYTLTADGRPERSLMVDLVWVLASAVGDLLLIPRLGGVGAALAAVIASGGSNPLAAWLARRSNHVVALTPVVRQTGLLLGCAGLGWMLQPENLLIALIWRLALLGVFIVASVGLSMITLDDLAMVLGDRIHRLWRRSSPPTIAVELPETKG